MRQGSERVHSKGILSEAHSRYHPLQPRVQMGESYAKVMPAEPLDKHDRMRRFEICMHHAISRTEFEFS